MAFENAVIEITFGGKVVVYGTGATAMPVANEAGMIPISKNDFGDYEFMPSNDLIKSTQQMLTEEKKSIARGNIGAVGNPLLGQFLESQLIQFKNILFDFTIYGDPDGKFIFGTCRNESDIAQIGVKKYIGNSWVDIVSIYRPTLQSGEEFISGGEWNNSGYSFSFRVNWDKLASIGRIFEEAKINPRYAFEKKYEDAISDAKREILLSTSGIVESRIGSRLVTLEEQMIFNSVFLDFTIYGTPSGEFYYFGTCRNESDIAQIGVKKIINGNLVDIISIYRPTLQSGEEFISGGEWNNSGYSFSFRVNWDKLASIGRIFEDVRIGVVSAFTSKTRSKLKGIRGGFVGDSVTEALGYQNLLVQNTGLIATTHAKGGAGMKVMVDGNGSDFPALTASFFDDKDFVTFFGGFNNRWMPQGGIDETNSVDYFMGQFNYAINKIQTLINGSQNRNCKLIVILGHKMGKNPYTPFSALETYPVNSAGQNWFTLTRTMLLKCQLLSIPTIDLFSLSGINEFNWDITTVNTLVPGSDHPDIRDNMHLNSLGYKYITYTIQNALESLF